MSEIRRYALKWLVFGDGPRVMAEYDGDYVLYTDHIAALEAVKAGLAEYRDHSQPYWEDRATKAEATLKLSQDSAIRLQLTVDTLRNEIEAREAKNTKLDGAIVDILFGWDFWQVSPDDREPPRDAIRRARALRSTLVPSPALEANQHATLEWQDISTAPKNTKVLAGYQNELGNWRTVTACYHTQLDWSDEYGDHEEEFAPEAWYEDNDSSEVIYPTSCVPTHWMPLPSPPAALTNPTQDGADACEDRG